MDITNNVKPKIVVTFTKAFNENQKEIEEIKANEAFIDIIEYRADLIEGDVTTYINDIKALKAQFPNIKIMFTYRTQGEGGKGNNDTKPYFDLCMKMIDSKLIDILDIELMIYADLMDQLLKHSRENGVEILLSHHDVLFTPRIKDMMAIYDKMRKLGADYCKLAVMPLDGRDVVNLLSAVYETKQKCDLNIVGIAMGELGKITRLAGGVFGSYLTYAHLGTQAAPGQLHVTDLKTHLELFNIK